MTRHARYFILLLTALLAFSCGKGNESPYNKGLAMLGKDNAAAENAFLMAIAANDHRTEACLEYADLCSEQPEKTALAIFYYRQYLNATSDDENKNAVQQKLAALEKRLATRLNQKIGDAALDENSLRIKMLEQHTLRQKQWIDELSTENLKLRRQLSEAQKQADK